MCNETVDKLQRATFLECGQWWSLIFCGARLVHGSSLSLGQKKNSSGMYILCSESRLLRHLSLASESGEMLSQIKEMVVGKGVPILNNSSFQVILHSRYLFTLGQSTSLGPSTLNLLAHGTSPVLGTQMAPPDSTDGLVRGGPVAEPTSPSDPVSFGSQVWLAGLQTGSGA